MTEDMNNIEELVDKNEKLIDIWGRRTPKFEKKYEQTVMRVISDYGVGASENTVQKERCWVQVMNLTLWLSLSTICR